MLVWWIIIRFTEPICWKKSKHNWIKVNFHAFGGQTQLTHGWILICHYSEIHEQSISLSHYNDPITCIFIALALWFPKSIWEWKGFLLNAHIANFCPINYSIMIVKYSQPVNTIQLSILFSADLTRRLTHMAR